MKREKALRTAKKKKQPFVREKTHVRTYVLRFVN